MIVQTYKTKISDLEVTAHMLVVGVSRHAEMAGFAIGEK